MPQPTDIVISAVGVCAPLGHTSEALWESVSHGRHGFREVDRYDLSDLKTRVASAFSAEETIHLRQEAGHEDAAIAFAIHAGRRALADADLDEAALAALPVILGTSAGAADTEGYFDAIKHKRPEEAAVLLETGAFASFLPVLCEALGLTGPRSSISTACASGGHAFGLAQVVLESGLAERVLVITSDSVHPWLFAGFSAVGALSAGVCAPFGGPVGMSLGEGAGAVLLETRGSARARHARARATLLGWGGSSDAYHATSPEPRGTGIAQSMRSALAHAGRDAGSIDYYNAHGTGTEANDSAESLALDLAGLGDVPVSSTKSQIGHTQGSAGMLEALTTVAAIAHDALPPSLRATPPRKPGPANVVREPTARPTPVGTAISHSSAFGGTNVTLVLGGPTAEAPVHSRRPVYVRSVGTVTSFGGSVLDALRDGREAGKLPDPELRRALRRVQARGLDPLSRILTAACAEALRAADMRPGRPGSADRLGMLVGTADGPQTSVLAFAESCRPSLASASAAAFARMVMNAPAGAAGIALQAKGPSITLRSGVGSGHQALLLGVHWLATHTEFDGLLAAAADETSYLSADRARTTQGHAPATEAGAAVLLDPNDGAAQLAGWGWTGPSDWRTAVTRATREATPDLALVTTDAAHAAIAASLPVDCPVLVADAQLGLAPSANAVLAVCAAVEAMSRGEARHVLVLSVSRDSGATATLWSSKENPA